MKKIPILGFVLMLYVANGLCRVMPGDDFNANASMAAESLQRWYNSKGLWDTTGWWNAAHCMEAIENVIVANNGGQHRDVLAKTFRRNSGKNFLNEFYDDEGWWALAWIRAFDLTGDSRYLEMTKIIFADMEGGWDSHCDGGIWWKKDRHYKNAIANELFLLAAIRLHQRTPGDGGPGSYFDWAVREWTWFKNSGMINAQNLINDGLNRRCENNGKTTWTYNQGVILGGLTELYKATGDLNYLNEAVAIADAATKTLSYTNGTLREPCEPDTCGGADVPQFKGIFIRYLADLYDVTHKPAYGEFLFNNARSVWRNNRDESNRFGLRWTGPVDAMDAARHSSAMMPITALAEPVTTNLVFAKGAGSPAFNHEVGGPSGTLAWTCNASNTTRAGFMQSGPFLASLSKGVHTVHFRLAVNALGQSSSNLVWLDVRENNGGTILACRDVTWNQFVDAGRPQDFELIFTNQTPGNPLEFRVYWNNLANAPALILSDVTMDGFHNWVAANLAHDLGRLDGLNAWAADPVRDHAPGFLVRGPGTPELATRSHSAVFELKVDNFNWDKSIVATVSVVDAGSGEVIIARDLARTQFASTLYQSFVLNFTAVSGRRYDCRTFWHYGPHAPRLTQRSLMVKPVFNDSRHEQNSAAPHNL